MQDQESIPQTTEPQISNGWLPILIGILLCILVVLVWWMHDKHEQAKKKRLVETEASLLAGYIKADMRSRIPSLQRIVNRWKERGGTPKDEFFSDTKDYISSLPGFQALEWVDKSFHVRWVVPLSGNEQAQDLNLAFEEKRRVALEKARDLRIPTMTDPVDLVQGGKGFLVYFPIFVQGEFDGFILAVFRVQEWLNYVFSIKGSPEGLENFKVSVFIDDSFVFKQTSWDSSSSTFVEAVKHVELMGHRFTVYCRPTAAFFRHHDTLVYKVIAGVSLLLAVLISFVVHLFQKATTETWRTHLAKKTLEITIQELKKTKNELYDASSHLDFATKAGNIGIWAWNITNNTMSWNTIMYELYDVPPDIHPTYETWYKALHPEDCLKTEALLQNSVQGKTVFNTEFRIILTDGVVRSIKTAARIERDSAGEPIRMTGVNLDITEQKKAEEKIYHLANHDALTGLPSLRLAKERALMAINTAHRNKTSTAVLFIDLDGFKHVNDNYGHDAGDALLNEVAKRLLSCVRETDTVARIGGDEFLIILTEFISSNDVGLITEKLVKIVSQAFIFRKNHIAVGASIGIALYPVNGKDIEKLIKQADEAMYKIKKSGKNGYAFVTPEK